MSQLALFGGPATVRTPEARPPALHPGTRRALECLLEEASANLDRLSDLEGVGVVREFEDALAKAAGAQYALAVSSGTSALITALAACGIGPGDEVVVATYGWGGTVAAVLAIGATPVLADVDPVTFNLASASAADCLSTRTRAILATHLFGHPADIAALSALAEANGLRLIFDAAQALGATFQGMPIGGYGDATAFSFGRGKLVTTGEGGMVVTNSREMFERMVLASQHPLRAFSDVDDRRLRRYIDEVSLSSRMHPLAAALGLPRLADLSIRLTERRATCQALSAAIFGLPGFRAPRDVTPGSHAFHAFPLTYRADEFDGLPRDLVLRALQAEGVPVLEGPVRIPIHLRERFLRPEGCPTLRGKGFRHAHAPVAEARCREQELLLESPSRWLAVPARRLRQFGDAFAKVCENRSRLADALVLADLREDPPASAVRRDRASSWIS